MSAHPDPSPEAIQACAEWYGAILADPEQAEQLRAARARQAEIDRAAALVAGQVAS